jgi:hypothetical protein
MKPYMNLIEGVRVLICGGLLIYVIIVFINNQL